MKRLWRFTLLPLAAIGIAACAVFEGPGGPLAGSWLVDSIPSPLTPLNMTLSQMGPEISGTGGAMGVDTPVPVTVAGTDRGSAVALTFYVANGSGGSIQYTATLQDANHMVGTAVFYHLFTTTSVESHQLAFTKP